MSEEQTEGVQVATEDVEADSASATKSRSQDQPEAEEKKAAGELVYYGRQWKPRSAIDSQVAVRRGNDHRCSAQRKGRAGANPSVQRHQPVAHRSDRLCRDKIARPSGLQRAIRCAPGRNSQIQ